MKQRMSLLEELNVRDRMDGSPRLKRLRQIPPETGRFLALTAVGAPEGGEWVEIGTSAGYSALWLSLACRERGMRLKTYEILPSKVQLARETFKAAGVEDVVQVVPGDALKLLAEIPYISFCFIDAEKELYEQLYELVVPKLIAGGLLMADNVTSHFTTLQGVIERATADPRVDALVVPIGKGELLCRRRSA